jgi:hypothetical protein
MSMALRSAGAYRDHNSVSFLSNNDKTVAYIPMVHVGKKEFYADIKTKVDSLQRNGYIVFMESVRVKDSLTAPQKDTLRRKIRQLLGVDLNSKGYIDTINGTFMGRKFKNKQGLTNQPRYSKIGVDTLSGRIEDVPVNELLAAYEKQYGKIVLSDCDYKTAFESKYTCIRPVNSWMSEFVLGYRNKHLADAIAAEPHKKIAVMYGALHYGGLLKELTKSDSTWTERKDLYRAK